MVEDWNDDDRAIGEWSSIVKYRSPLNSPIYFGNVLKEIALLQHNLIQEDNSEWIDYKYEFVHKDEDSQHTVDYDSDVETESDTIATSASILEDVVDSKEPVSKPNFAYT